MLKWLSGFPFAHYIIMGAVGVAIWMYGDLTLTKQALHNERSLREQWQHVAEVQSRIQARDTIIVRASNEADRAIREAPNANTPIAPDVAAAWGTGIDSVRDAGTAPTGKHDLPRSPGSPPKRRGPDTGPASAVLERSRSSVLAVQR